ADLHGEKAGNNLKIRENRPFPVIASGRLAAAWRSPCFCHGDCAVSANCRILAMTGKALKGLKTLSSLRLGERIPFYESRGIFHSF
ncbi:MAG: hypothetical protein Q9P90_18050, partial [candidate division KSB1 bacterium]|nr:hypothetical protein [candidate division KSB1 bacterium]